MCKSALLLAVLVGATLQAQPQGQILDVTTLAGFPRAGHRDGAGDFARFSGPLDVACDPAGNVYVVDGWTIRKVTPYGEVTTFAGSPDSKQGDWADGPGLVARFSFPAGIAADAQGNLYVAEYCKLRKISPTGVVTTLLGGPNYLCGFSDGPPGTASIHDVRRLTVDNHGAIYFTSTYGHTVRKMALDGVVTTIGGQDDTPGYKDGLQSRFNNPLGVAVDASGNVFVADMGNRVIRRIDAFGYTSTFANVAAQPLTTDQTGYLFAIVDNLNIVRIAPDGSATKIAGGAFGSRDGRGSLAQFGNPQGITSDLAGVIYIADYLNTTIRRGVLVSNSRRRAVRK